MRDLPVLQQQAKDSISQRTFWLFDLHLKADGIYAAEDFYFSTQAVTARGHFYEPFLKSKPQIRHILGGATDGGSAKIDNTDFSFGQTILPKERYVQGSAVEIYFAWKLPDDSIETDKIFDGELADANLVVADNAVNLSLVGDLYTPRSVLGAFPLAQRCVHKFNVGGLLSPDESACGWQTSQGGDPLRCGKTEDDCLAHFNLHRIGAVPFFANVTVRIVASSVESSGFNQIGRIKNPAEIDPVYPVNF